MRRLALGLLTLLALVWVAPAAPSGQAAQPQPASGDPTFPVRIPFDLVARKIMIPATVNASKPLAFVLDTGDRFALVDFDLAKKLGLKFGTELKLKGVGGRPILGAVIDNGGFSILGLPGFFQPIVAAVPLSELAPRIGHDFDGIIGAEFISQFVVEVDYLSRQLTLYDKTTYTYTGSGQVFPVDMNESGHVLLDAGFDLPGGKSAKGKVSLDLGSSMAVALQTPFVNANRLMDTTPKTIRALGVGGLGGTSVGRYGRLPGLRLGRFTLDKPVAFLSSDGEGAMASSTTAGTIGQQIASRFKIVLDYGRRRIILEPNADYGKPFDLAGSGLLITADAPAYKVFRVADVLEGSPGWESNFHVDDIIVSIDGKPGSQWTLTEIQTALERPSTHQFVVGRNGERLTLSVTTRVII